MFIVQKQIMLSHEHVQLNHMKAYEFCESFGKYKHMLTEIYNMYIFLNQHRLL
jgi:hypothetical protein